MEELTESARQCLVSQGIVVGGFSIVVSLGLSVIGILVTTKNNDILHFISLYQLAILEIVCGLSSLTVVLYVWWIIASYRNRQLIVRSKYLDEKMSKGLLALILPILFTFAAFIVSAIFLMIKTESSTTYELRSAMLLYGTDFTRKIIIDKLQSSLKCCGSQAMEDWFSVDWQNSETPPEPQCENDTHCSPSWESNWDSVPFSCCCLESPPPCIHRELRSLGTESLYSSGCAEKLDEAVFIFVLLAFLLFFISTVLMAIILYSARKLQTSARSAICKGDATAPGVWWLLAPPGDNCRRKSSADCLPLLGRPSRDSHATTKSKKQQGECKSKIKKLVTPTLFFQKSILNKSNDEDSSDDWVGKVCESSHSTSNSSLFTTTVANNTILASRQSVSDTAVAQVDMSHHCEYKARPLYRS